MKGLKINIRPTRDWNIMVILLALALITISVLAWRVYLSNKIGGGYFKILENDNRQTADSIDINNLNKAVSIIKNRAIFFQDLGKTKNGLVDPSQ